MPQCALITVRQIKVVEHNKMTKIKTTTQCMKKVSFFKKTTSTIILGRKLKKIKTEKKRVDSNETFFNHFQTLLMYILNENHDGGKNLLGHAVIIKKIYTLSYL